MDDAVFLNIRSTTDPDIPDIPPQHRPCTDVCPLFDNYVSDQYGLGVNKCAWIDLRPFSFKFIERHNELLETAG